MPKNVGKILAGFIFLVFLAGCGVQARKYVQVKERVDQEMQGNAGYLMGTPSAKDTDRSQIRKTRKVYVLEVSTVNVESPEEDIVSTTSAAPSPSYESTETSYPSDDTVETSESRIILPNFEEETTPEESSAVGPASATDYTVMKDDTMQKISKKFYDSYSKWPKIYEANKDKISDPNRIKPGITITIPPLQ